MQKLAPTPFWFADRLADDTAAFLQVTPGPDELADYYSGLLALVDSLEAAVLAIRQAVNETVVGESHQVRA